MREPELPLDPVDCVGTPEWADEQHERKERRERYLWSLHEQEEWEREHCHQPVGHC